MPTTCEYTDSYVAQFERFEEGRINADWLAPIRKAAIARFGEMGFPTTRDEDWGYTNVAAIARADFAPGTGASVVGEDQILPLLIDVDGPRLVFIDGKCSVELSRLDGLNGVTVCGLAEAIRMKPELVEPHLGRLATHHANAFVALNTAMFADGAFVHVPQNAVMEQPVQLLFLSTGLSDGAAYPRNLIVVEQSGQAKVAEIYAGISEGAYLTCPVTEIVARDNAIVRHYKVNCERDTCYHMATINIHQTRDSDVWTQGMTFGGLITRNDISTVMDGEGGHCQIDGLSMLGGDQHCDNFLRVDHAKPHCDSREYFKGVLDDRSHSVFTGRIIVREDAQKTDGKQTNMNLLLSNEALADSKPQLEILADDVKCTHGATIGQIDSEALFYLRSRGLSERAAKGLMVYAFAGEVVDRIEWLPLRDRLRSMLADRLPEGAVVQGLEV